MSKLSRAQRRQMIEVMIEIVADIVNDGGIPVVVAITPTGPGVYSQFPQHIAMHLLKLVVDQIDWANVEDPPADWFDALGQLQ